MSNKTLNQLFKETYGPLMAGFFEPKEKPLCNAEKFILGIDEEEVSQEETEKDAPLSEGCCFVSPNKTRV